MMSFKSYGWISVVLAFVVAIAFNAMANGVPLGGKTTGEISDMYPTLFTPAGFTFSIWALIYASLLVFVVFQSLPSQRGRKGLDRIRVPFVINCLSNAAWIVVWHYDFLWLSLVVMGSILGTLLVIYGRLRTVLTPRSMVSFVCVKLPFSLYTGWICVASIANLSVIQFAMGWDHVVLDNLSWTYVKLAVAGCVGAWFVLVKRDFVIGAVVCWAGVGIAANQAPVPAVAGAAMMLVYMMAILTVVTGFVNVSGIGNNSNRSATPT